MGLLTTEKEKQFPKKREILTAESSEGTEYDTRRPSIPQQTTVRGPIQVKVVRRWEKSERRVAKRRRLVSDDEGDLALEVRRTETEVDVIRQSRTRARPKKRANMELVAAEVLDSSVEKTVVPIESGRCADLEEICGGLRKSNENGQKMTADLLTRLEKSREAYEETVKRSKRLITSAEKREKKHFEELATLEARRAEEVRIAEELRGKIAEAKTAEEDLRSKILEIEGKCEAEFRRAEELSASLTEGVRKHEEELANWAKKLTDCESARTSEVECKLKVELECRWLWEQLGKEDMRLQESQRRMEKAEEAYRQLRGETTDELKLCLEKCMNGFVMWGLQHLM
ncbi:hypothetical protein AXG93_3674s1000 [Marchantia polymorpha subsp. ruderalis]|uniref:Uncharacterized protein n=1 Tax=Marchantia polymorpha subsp. ruderalis TaxID=1480154 RepID=A0A176VQY7_MARPO|nr:hypothetical protein AXG93_3674s1000 [Marchantia polymorpha subsp. ruderalis]